MDETKGLVLVAVIVLLIVACITAGTTYGAINYQTRFTERVNACLDAGNHPLECRELGTRPQGGNR